MADRWSLPGKQHPSWRIASGKRFLLRSPSSRDSFKDTSAQVLPFHQQHPMEYRSVRQASAQVYLRALCLALRWPGLEKPTREVRERCVGVAGRANYGRIRPTTEDDSEQSKRGTAIGRWDVSPILERDLNTSGHPNKGRFTNNPGVLFVIGEESRTTIAQITGTDMNESTTICETVGQNVVFNLADRYETLATAVAGRGMNISLAFTRCGEVTGSSDESVRHAITKLARFHFAPTANSKKRLIRMDENPGRTSVAGWASNGVAKPCRCEYDEYVHRSLYQERCGSSRRFGEPYGLVVGHRLTRENGNAAYQRFATLDTNDELNCATARQSRTIDSGSNIRHKLLYVCRAHNTLMSFIFIPNFQVRNILVFNIIAKALLATR